MDFDDSIKKGAVPATTIKWPFLLFCIILITNEARSQDLPTAATQKIDSLIQVAATYNSPDKKAAIGTEILSAAKEANYMKGQVYGYLSLGTAAYYTGLYPKSISYLNKAASHKAYLSTHPLVHSQINIIYAFNYNMLNLFDFAKQYFLNAIQLAKRDSNETAGKHYRKIAYYRLVLMQFAAGRTDSVLYYLKNPKKNGLPDTTPKNAYADIIYAHYYLHHAAIDSTQYYLEQAKPTIKNSTTFFEVLLWDGFGHVAYQADNYRKSVNHFHKALSLVHNLQMKTHIWSHIADAYGLLGNKQKKQYYQRLSKPVKDSLRDIYRGLSIQLMNVDSIVSSNEQEDKATTSVALYLVIASLAGAVIAFLYRRRKKRKEVESKDISSPHKKDIIRLAKEDDSALEYRFRDVYPDVYQKLDNLEPALTKSEMRFCTYIYLDFDTKDIARYTHIQPKSVQMKKYRLRKKYGLNEGQKIQQWLKGM